MRHLKLKNAALVALLAAALVVVGVLVWPTPKPAMAITIPAHLTLEWAGAQSRDVHATVQLYTTAMVPIGDPKDLQPDGAFQEWTANVNAGDTYPFYAVFNWDYDPVLLDWGFIWTVGGNEDNPPADPVEITSSGADLAVIRSQA